MNSALLLAAYFTMLLSPCIYAEWGDLFNFRWVPALVRRRRTHPQESLRASFCHERYAMALAAEAAFLAGTDEIFAAPRPFLVQRKPMSAESPAFLEARQRVAARVAQLVVAQKLRDAAAAEDAASAAQEQPEVVEIPADVPVWEPAQEQMQELAMPEAAAASATQRQPVYRTLLEAMGLYSSTRKTQPVPLREAMPHTAEQVPAAVFRGPTLMPRRELAEVVPFAQSRGGPEPVPPGPPRRKPGESSDVVEIAA